MTEGSILDVLEELITTVVEPAADDVDANGTFPRSAVTALGDAGFRLVELGRGRGRGGTLDDAAQVVRRLARHLWEHRHGGCMHYCATAVIEQYGSVETRQRSPRQRSVDVGVLRDWVA